MNYKEATDIVKQYGKKLNANDPRFQRRVSLVLIVDDSTMELNSSFLMFLGNYMEYIAVFSLCHEDKVYPITELLRFEQYEIVSELEELKAPEETKLPVCDTCNDTHMITRFDRSDVMCARCPVPCGDCRGGRGAYCLETPCDCSCHKNSY